MASVEGLIDERVYDAMSIDSRYELRGVVRQHVGAGIYRGRYPDPAAVTASLKPGKPATNTEWVVEIDWENIPRPHAPEDWQKTETGLYVPKSDLRQDEKKLAVPVPENGLTPVELRMHGKHLGRIIRNSLSGDPLWEKEEMGWKAAERNGADPTQMLGVKVELQVNALWDATYSKEEIDPADFL